MQRADSPSRCRRSAAIALTGACATVVVSCASASAQSTWVGGTGDWFDPANWSGGAVPTENTTFAYIRNGGTAQIAGGDARAKRLEVGDAFSLSGTVRHTAGTLTTGGTLPQFGFLGIYEGEYHIGGTAELFSAEQFVMGHRTGGRMTQSGGTNNVSHLVIGGDIPSNPAVARYELSAGTIRLDGSMSVGSTSAGEFVQTGGTVEGTTQGTLTVGSSRAGTYRLEGGSVAVTSLNVGSVFSTAAASTFVHAGGTSSAATLENRPSGTFRLTGGAASFGSIVNRGTFDFSANAGGTLAYAGIADFSGGAVLGREMASVSGSGQSLLIVPSGADPAAFFGTFATTGLTHVAGTTLDIPTGRSVVGTGTLNDHVSVAGGSIAGPTLNKGLAISNGGSASTGRLAVANATSGMDSGSLSATIQQVGPQPGSAFAQSGGSNTAAFLDVRAGGTYRLSGGSLSAASLANTGTLDFSGGQGDLTVAGGIANLASGTVLSPGNVGVTLQPGSLLVVPAGFDPATGFRSFNNAGSALVHQAGSPLTIPAGTQIVGTATLNDPVTVQGSLLADTTGGRAINLAGGVIVPSGGVVRTGNGEVVVNRLDSRVDAGGELVAATLTVGRADAGAMTIAGTLQANAFETYVGRSSGGNGSVLLSGGMHTTNRLTVGDGAGATGAYRMTGGALVASQVTLGRLGTGTFTQDGGSVGSTFGSGSLYLGEGSGVGTYRLNGGTAKFSTVRVGLNANGKLELLGGSSVVDDLYLYSFSGPQVNAVAVRGGSHRIERNLQLSSNTSLAYSGGSLHLEALSITGDTATLRFELDPDNPFAPITLGNMASLGGRLEVDLPDGVVPDIGIAETFDLMVAKSASGFLFGSFRNVANGARLATDGGSFKVNYGAGSPFGVGRLVLSDFQPIPEPAGVGLALLAGATGLRRRRCARN